MNFRNWILIESINWSNLKIHGSGCYAIILTDGINAYKIGIIGDKEVNLQKQLAQERLAIPILGVYKNMSIPKDISILLAQEIYQNRDLTWDGVGFGNHANVIVMPMGEHIVNSSNLTEQDIKEIQELRIKVDKRCKELGFNWDNTLGNVVKYKNKWLTVDFGDWHGCKINKS